MKLQGDVDDGVFDWMLLSEKEGMTPAALLAQAHATVAVARNPQHKRERDRDNGGHRRTSRAQHQEGVSPLILNPSPARIKDSGRRPNANRSASGRLDASLQPIAPGSRRASQQLPQPQHQRDGSIPHPYAATANPNGYRPGGGGPLYNARHSNGALNAHVHNGSESMLYGQGAGAKNAANSREGTTAGNGVRAMMVYDRDQSQRPGDDGGHGGQGRQRSGFFGIFCCRD